MNNFERFKERNKKRAQAQTRGNTSFVLKGYNSIEIKNGSTTLYAAVVNEQEKDSAYIYTRILDPLTIGSIWKAKSLHFLITEELITIKDVDYHKYIAQLCNTEINGVWGRFIVPEESYINVALKEKITYLSQQKPIIILPSNTLSFGDKIVIKDRAWMVQEYDNISTEGITYYSLTPSTISKNVTSVETATNDYNLQESSKLEGIKYIAANKQVTLSTEDAYLQYDNANIKIVSRSATSVTFYLPFGVTQVNIKVKEAGDIVSYTYRLI